ncbi:MAG: hypothetical protein OXK20_04150 [Deltaproteobacteria bacterium]|nr:hypothetical protein [Deltaproteobacteria bacterium]
MRFELMGAFLDREGDDRFSLYQRALWLTYHSIFTCTFVLMVTTACDVAYRGQSLQGALLFTALFSMVMWVWQASYKVDRLLYTSLRRVYVATAILTLAWAGAEAGTLHDWWAMQEILPWWRGALFVMAMAVAALWAGEKAFEALRGREDRKSHILA